MRYSTFNAKHCLMVYEDEQSTLDRPACLLYDKQDNKWGNARTLSPEEVDTIFKFRQDQFHAKPAVLPECMLWYEADKCLMWYQNPCTRTMTVRGKKAKYSHPGLVFMVSANTMRICVYSKKEAFRPTFTTKLYENPYSNVDTHYGHGNVGLCRVPKFTQEYAHKLDAWEEWTDMFYESGFNKVPTPRNKIKQKDLTLGEWICG